MKGYSSKGLTLIELLIAVCLSSIVVLALYAILTAQNRTYILQDDTSAMQQSLRVALESMARTVRMGGFGKLSTWTSMAGYTDAGGYGFASLNFAVYPTSGTGNTLHLVGCVDAPAGTLAVAVAGNPTTITVNAGDVANFNTTTNSNINIGGMENAQIKSIAGTVLTIDTDLGTAGNQGLQSNYNVGTPVYIVKWITYSVDTAQTPPALLINKHDGAGSQQLAQYITSLSVIVTGKLVDITLNGQTTSREGKVISALAKDKIRLRN
jgi:prepilin-type N-terminal cleavage/methylation domain-containing protein